MVGPRGARAAALAGGLTLLLTSCSAAGDTGGGLEGLATRAPSAPVSPSPVSDAEAVTAAYTGYWTATWNAVKAPRRQARALLEPYLVADGVAEELDNIDEWQRKDRESYGRVVPHVYKVRVTGKVAKVRDCQDASGAAVADARSHKPYPETFGSSHAHFSATLRKGGDGRWRLVTKSMLEAPCTRPSR